MKNNRALWLFTFLIPATFAAPAWALGASIDPMGFALWWAGAFFGGG